MVARFIPLLSAALLASPAFAGNLVDALALCADGDKSAQVRASVLSATGWVIAPVPDRADGIAVLTDGMSLRPHPTPQETEPFSPAFRARTKAAVTQSVSGELAGAKAVLFVIDEPGGRSYLNLRATPDGKATWCSAATTDAAAALTMMRAADETLAPIAPGKAFRRIDGSNATATMRTRFTMTEFSPADVETWLAPPFRATGAFLTITRPLP